MNALLFLILVLFVFSMPFIILLIKKKKIKPLFLFLAIVFSPVLMVFITTNVQNYKDKNDVIIGTKTITISSTDVRKGRHGSIINYYVVDEKDIMYEVSENLYNSAKRGETATVETHSLKPNKVISVNGVSDN